MHKARVWRREKMSEEVRDEQIDRAIELLVANGYVFELKQK